MKLCDDQHRQLVGMVNDLHEAMANGKGNQVVGPILAGLVEYTQTHFKDEEALLAKHAYPGLAIQKEEHRKLIQQVQATQEKLKAGKVMLSVEVMTFLKNWLVNHIKGEDARYGPFLNDRGVG